MANLQLESLSDFGRAAVKLDNDFTELVRLSGQLKRLDIDSESGLDRAVKILSQFAQHGQNISAGIQDFSKFLQEARQRAEVAAQLVTERAQQIRERKEIQSQIREKLGRVEQSVQTVNASLAGFKKEGSTNFSEKEKLQLRTELERINVDLKRFMADTQVIKDEAAGAKFKSVERDAQNLLDALRASCRRVDKITAQ